MSMEQQRVGQGHSNVPSANHEQIQEGFACECVWVRMCLCLCLCGCECAFVGGWLGAWVRGCVGVFVFVGTLFTLVEKELQEKTTGLSVGPWV